MKTSKILFKIALLVLIFSCSTQEEPVRFPLAANENIDATQLNLAFENSAQIKDIRSLVVSRNEVIVAEEYFNGTNSEWDIDHHVMSVTKSITSTLVGIAIDKGFIQNLNQNVSDFLGDEVNTINPELSNVTLKQLLTMTAGHDWKEIDDGSEYLEWIASPNQVEYIINKEIVNLPGTVFDYSDGAAHLVSYIIEKATGMNTSIFADEYLFKPMGLGDIGRYWIVDNQNVSLGGVGLKIGPHDMQKIGFLYLNNGFYNNQQIVSSSWISEVTSAKLSTGNILPYLSSYGYYWWVGNSHGINYMCAIGYGGQFILISKEKKLVVTATCNYKGSSSQAGTNWTNIFDIIINDILVAVD